MANDADSLDERLSDTVMALTKGALGVVPGVGSVLAEILGSIVPNQRIDRVAEFLRDLALRLAHLEREALRKKLTTPERIDILEDGMMAAARALTNGRRRMLAASYASVLTQEHIDHAYTKRVLKIINDLSDTELLLLAAVSAAESEPPDNNFLSNHEAALRGPAYYYDQPLGAQPAYTKYESLLKNLVALQLVTMRGTAKLVGHMSAPTLFEDGTWRANYTLTPLGESIAALANLRTSEDGA